jgi:catechol 2,3-dioxygenase-like lactoylglutathione lyase family enzyme
MITRLSHTVLYVLDQDVAYDFYVAKLGFQVVTDASMGEAGRWLTVAPKGQPDFEISLMVPEMTTQGEGDERAVKMRELIQKGTISGGVLESDDIARDYEELTAKGVNFKSPPTEKFYGIEALMIDPFGNWFSVTQRKH